MYRAIRLARSFSLHARVLALALLLPTLVALLGTTPVAAATDHVTTCSGEIAAMGSLPNVIASASAGDTVDFDLDCPPGAPIIFTHSFALLNNVTIDGSGHDVAVDGGGAVGVFRVNSGVTATINGLTIQHGVISGPINNGGGIWNQGGTLTVTNCTFSGNSAFNGGAIENDGTMTVTNSTFFGNSATGSGAGNGGGLLNLGTLTVTNSTITGNSAGNGGGVAGALAVTNTIIAGNSATVTGPDAVSTVTSGGHNLIGNADGSSGWIASDQTGTTAAPLNAHLGPLAANGGHPQTVAPLAGSPAIGTGDPTVCAQAGAGKVDGVDERGLPRPASACDVGAFQVQGTQLLASLPSGVAGSPLLLTVLLYDGYGALLAPYTGTVHFTSSDPLANLPADYTFTGKGGGNDNDVHPFLVTLNTAGTQTVTIIDTLASTLTFTSTTVIVPLVSTMNPTAGGTAGGTPVTITGRGFGTVPANIDVRFGGISASLTSTTGTQLIVTAPAHAAGPVDVVVLVNGQSAILPHGFAYTTPGGLPNGQPGSVTGGIPATLPAARSPGQAQSGIPSPLPVSRP